MAKQQMLHTPDGRDIAYHYTPGKGPGVVFLGGFMSDMEGTKATHLETWAHAQGRAFLRFDYSGHGASSGAFQDGCIGEWAMDTQAVIAAVTEGAQILVGSSMGGWIALFLCREQRANVAGLVTIAAAPDFTEDIFWAGFGDAERAQLDRHGVVEVPSGYGEPYPITRKLIEDGRKHLLLRHPLAIPVPCRFLQGDQDKEVSVETANRLFRHAEGLDLQLTVLKGADHSFSSSDGLRVIEHSISNVLHRLEYD